MGHELPWLDGAATVPTPLSDRSATGRSRIDKSTTGGEK
jgi:hypothetical protein